ncbi:type VII secretion-associated protein [Prescottella sp. R16]|uniref:type VII secretion-associated protein n=1 Tax=Prescottella sp. R16 TaxID=3064529 RepID=UPI00272DE2E2|nr:type VII secretion-associated protein [Prescottella sp. R16]
MTGPAGVVRIPDPAVRDGVDGIDDASAVDLLAAALHRGLGQAFGGTGFVPDLTVLHPSHWGAPRCGVLETAARRCAQQVTSVPVALAVPSPAPGSRHVVLECGELSSTATLVEGSEHGPRVLACELASDTGTLDLRDDPAGISTIADLVRAVAGDRRPDAVVVAGESDDAVIGLLAGTLAAPITAAPPPALLAPSPPQPPQPQLRSPATGGAATWTDPAPEPRPKRRAPIAGAVAAVVLAAAVGVAAAVLPGSRTGGPEPLRHFEIGGATVTLASPWEIGKATGNRLDLVPGEQTDGQPRRRIIVVAVDVGDDTDRDAVARALEREIVDRGPDGPFTAFDPSADLDGRPAVTYLESPQDDSTVRWHVLVDDGVQISVGCQYTEGGWDLLADDCTHAVRSVTVGPK